MVLLYRKILSCVTNVLDISTIPTPSYSPLSEPNFNSWAPLLTEVAYLIYCILVRIRAEHFQWDKDESGGWALLWAMFYIEWRHISKWLLMQTGGCALSRTERIGTRIRYMYWQVTFYCTVPIRFSWPIRSRCYDSKFEETIYRASVVSYSKLVIQKQSGSIFKVISEWWPQTRPGGG